VHGHASGGELKWALTVILPEKDDLDRRCLPDMLSKALNLVIIALCQNMLTRSP